MKLATRSAILVLVILGIDVHLVLKGWNLANMHGKTCARAVDRLERVVSEMTCCMLSGL